MAKLNERDEARRASRELDGDSRGDYSEALERGLLVLTAFERAEERMTQSQLARKLDLPRATVRRALLTLVHLGYVVTEERAYRLAPKVLTLASAYLSTNPVSHVLQPLCDEVSAGFGASCTVAVLDGATAMMIVRAVPRQPLAIGQGVGFTVPATRSALGQVLLAGLGEDELRAHLADHCAEHCSGDPDGAAIREVLAEVGKQGFAYVANAVEAGFHSIAVPLLRWDGTPVAALNVGSSVEHLTRADMLEKVLPALLDRARAVRPQLV
ncbi:IclR family transcriptional regulator domain-containing protein [Pseudonocardia sp. TRM90224]|uniref:IclR family transcriptional regulator domain-containing protein n=1 Tax=Pseudonocardia sp. TRM90224 TaxID=2812678 RepID=UPI001E43FA10|nr:helix-turn-helix domain-containing protein [Pseudonocardia sp. TRM90224]